MYLHQRDNWWDFSYDSSAILGSLAAVRAKQGMLLGKMNSLGFTLQDEAVLTSMTLEVIKSSEIEGEILNLNQVRSSLAKRLGFDISTSVQVSRYIDGVVELMLDATLHYAAPITDDRLFGWHNVLFPSGISVLNKIEVGKYRSGGMQVVSGAMGREVVHYEAPVPERVPDEMARFIAWLNEDNPALDPVLKAGIAHLWFVSIHPFDDGNGRITRAITEMLLCRADGTGKRFYSLSNQINLHRKSYYEVLEKTQKGDGDITEWLLWFFDCLDRAIESSADTLSSVLAKARFWDIHKEDNFNDRQRKIINILLDDFYGKLTTGKWAKIAKCSSDTALNDIKDLVAKGVLKKNDEGGRSTNYSIIVP
ncbi:MAG: Fic family protein [Candidatus Cryptobacteroides sp.]